MRFSSLVGRIGGRGAEAWAIHDAAMEAQARGRDVIPLSVGDPDAATPAPIVDAAVTALRAGDTHYPEIPGRHVLREAIARLHEERTGQPTGAANVLVASGAQNALFGSLLCLCEEGDEVLAPEPCYVTYEATLGAAGAAMVRVPQPADRGFRLDAATLERAITPRTRGILLANPNNPTGTVMTREELAAIAAVAERHDLWVVCDEVYAELAFDREPVSLAALPGMARRVVTVSSLSKSHAMTGWRIGWVVGPEALVGHLQRLALCMLYGLPGFIQQAALRAVADHARIAAEMREVYRARRDAAVRLLRGTPGLDVRVPEAGMFLLLDVRATGLSSLDFAWALFEATGVSVLDAAAFGPSAEGFVRLAFTVELTRLAEACGRISDFAARLHASGGAARAAAE